MIHIFSSTNTIEIGEKGVQEKKKTKRNIEFFLKKKYMEK